MKKNKGFAIVCDEDFNISKVLRDDFHLIDEKLHQLTFLRLIDKTNIDKAFRFQKEILKHNAAFNWEMNLLFADMIDTWYITGVKEDDSVFIIATHELQDINQFYNEYKNLFADQTSLILDSLNSHFNTDPTDIQTNIYNEFTKINNELTDLQRELSKKNFKMEQQQKQLELINRVLRHDLANYFSVIRSAVRLYDYEPKPEYLQEIVNYSLKGVDLIRNMKRLEAVFGDNIRVFSRNFIPDLEKVIAAYPQIEFDLEVKNCEILVNEGLESVLDNIIRNAIIHGGTKKIRIESQCTKSSCVIRIADFGKGISDKIKPRIFDENFKAGATGNTGLGLYIVRKMMQNFGGEVQVEDNQPQGAVFVLSFKLGKNYEQS